MQFQETMRRSSFSSQLHGLGHEPLLVMAPLQKQPANLALGQSVLQGESFDFLRCRLERDLASSLHGVVLMVKHGLSSTTQINPHDREVVPLEAICIAE
jgi:hypothetical protein